MASLTVAERTAKVVAWRKKNPAKFAVHVKRRNVKRDYGITLEAYNALRAMQNNKCAACGGANPTHLDHNHKTKKLRGFLCHGCNCAAGFAKDNPGRLRLLADYLERTDG